MPKPHTFPVLYDKALQISISKLKEWKYLKPNQINGGTITWSTNGCQTGSITINVNTYPEQNFIELRYNYRDQPLCYKVKLTYIISNLGKGFIWYFICPQTNKLCRNLYSVNGYFLHREAFSGCMYESQTFSKKFRQMEKTLKTYFGLEKLYSQLYQKYFKKTYAGKMTKKYATILNRIHKAEKIPFSTIERMLTL